MLKRRNRHIQNDGFEAIRLIGNMFYREKIQKPLGLATAIGNAWTFHDFS